MAEDTPVERTKASSEALAGAAVATQTIKEVAGVIDQLLQTSMSNPLVGAATVLMIADIMANKLNIISKPTAQLIAVLVTSSMAVDLTGSIITDLVDILPFAPKATNSVAQPSANVLVFGQGGDNSQLNALLQALANKK